jgi:predicted membrane protein DUF2142
LPSRIQASAPFPGADEHNHFFAPITSCGRQYRPWPIFGWRNFPLPWPLIICVIAALVVSACGVDVSALRINARMRLGFLALAASRIIGVALMIYLTWDPVGAHEVGRFHGRYFLPFLPFAMVSIANETLKNIWRCWPAAFITCLLSNLFALGLLARARLFFPKSRGCRNGEFPASK